MFYRAAVEGKRRNHLNRESQKDNKGALRRFHLIQKVNYSTFYFAKSFFYHSLSSEIKAATTVSVPQI